MGNDRISVLITQANECVLFWARVREHQARGLKPAGQVSPPPAPARPPVSRMDRAVQDDTFTHG